MKTPMKTPYGLSHFEIVRTKNYVYVDILVLFFLFFSFPMMAQDLLVTTKRDTLNCKMGKLKNDHYPITFVIDDEEISGLIHKDSVLFFKKDVFRGLEDNRLRPWYPLVEIGFDAGGAYQFGKFRIDDDLTDKSDLAARTGFFWGTDLTFYISKRIGYGIKYDYRSLLGGDIRYQYLGPMVSVRFLERKQSNHLFFSLSCGAAWMSQKNAPMQLNHWRPRIEMYTNSFSGTIAVGYSFRLAKHVSVRVKTSCNIAYPNYLKIRDVEKYELPSDLPYVPLDIDGYCHNMNTINLTAGFSFHK